MVEYLADMFRQNEWANLALIDACRNLTDAQLGASAEGTYGSIRETLHHIVGAEGGYAFRLGREPDPRLRGDDPWPGLDRLAEMVSASAASLIAASHEPPEGRIRVGGDEGSYEVLATVILAQAFHHSTEHRSQIATVLTTIGIEPPWLSAWDWGLATDRMWKVEEDG